MTRNTHCANCRANLEYTRETGESGLYSPNQAFELCVECFHTEYDLISRKGNNIPELIAKYKLNVEQDACIII